MITRTVQRPSLNPASLWGRSFLITNSGDTIQREALPENWLIVRANPLSIQAVQRANQQPYLADDPKARDLPY
ncbi:MAG: hypothetical protein IPM53_10410 [Anaerolineaceae bacterium]|nr:hypothetical protein [Anaerolineaceae bacterium]